MPYNWKIYYLCLCVDLWNNEEQGREMKHGGDFYYYFCVISTWLYFENVCIILKFCCISVSIVRQWWRDKDWEFQELVMM